MKAPYGEVIAEHSQRPHNRGALEAPDLVREGTSPLCGDRVQLELKLREGRIEAVRFDGEACMVAVAAASLLTDLLPGLTPAEAAAIPDEKLLAALQTQLRPSRVGCATLALGVLRELLAATAPDAARAR